VKEDVARRLEARHRAERDAHMLRLADLHQQRMLPALSDETGVGLGESKFPKLQVPVWMISPADQGAQAGPATRGDGRAQQAFIRGAI
jgi:hypothetical protein